MGKLLLFDGHSLAYRAFFALPPDLSTSSGQVTNAVYGFTAMLLKAMEDQQPTGIAVCFDRPEPTFRSEEYPEYKAEREAAPDLFVSQLPLINEVLEVLRIPQVDAAGYEADDVLATLATRAAAEGEDVVLVTGDRDTFQLIEDPHIKVMYNRRGISDVVLYDETGLEERYGISPRQYVDYAAMRGDPSDNLPGVPGVGEKTAAKLLQKYGDISSIYEHLDELTPKLRASLEASHDQVLLNCSLGTLVRDAPVGTGWRDCIQGHWDQEDVRKLFNTLAFRTLYQRALHILGRRDDSAGGGRQRGAEVDVVLVSDDEAVDALLGELRGSSGFAVDALAAGAGDAAGVIAVAAEAGRASVFELAKLGAHSRSELMELLADGSVPKDAHRLVESLRALAFPAFGGARTDTAVAAYLLDPAESRYLLEEVLPRHTGVDLPGAESSGGGAPSRQGALALEGPNPAEAGRRAAAICLLARKLEAELGEAGMRDLYETIERPLIGVLARMEQAGVQLDLDYLGELADAFYDRRKRFEDEIYRLAGHEFNINSTPQLREVLYEELQLTPGKKTKTGYSTDAATLELIADQHPIVEAILGYREVEKLRSTYVEALPPLVGADGRLHPHYNQTAAATGRISSENPNIQNIPIRKEIGRQIRRAFVAREGWLLGVSDYNQIELRVLAHLAEDPGLIEAFAAGVDVHAATASKVFGAGLDDVDEEMRRRAKAVNFGLMYGMEAFGLSQRLGIAPDEAREFIERYFESFPRVQEYMDDVVTMARKTGYTETLFGRRRPLPELHHRTFQVRKMGERMAMNAPIQGTAADIIKLAMVRLDAAFSERAMSARLLMQVHDELVVELPADERDEVAGLVRQTMENVIELRVPLVAEIGFGESWALAKA